MRPESWFIAGASLARVAPSAAELEAGVFLGGYGSYRGRPAKDVLDAPCARAMYLAHGNRAALLLALDLVGIDAASVRALRARIARATSVPPEAVLVSCTHSHASPDTQGIWGGVPRSYRRRLLDAALETARTAHLRARPVELRVASSHAAGLTRNRRGWTEVDTTLAALQALDERGDTVATLVNFACHPVTLPAENRGISRDFPGALADRLDSEFGGVTLYVNGAQGDVNPARSGGVRELRDLGDVLAKATVEALRNADQVDEGLRVAARRPLIPVAPERLPPWARRLLGPVTPPLRALAASGSLARLADALASRRRADLAQVLGGFAATLPGALSTSRGAAIQTVVTAIALGREAVAVTVPGEATTRLALLMKRALKAPHRFVLGLTHDTLGYVLPPDEWMAAPISGYEESVSLGRGAGPAWERAARDAAMTVSG